MSSTTKEKFPILVTKSGIHICVDDILSFKEGVELMHKLQDALFELRVLQNKEEKK